MGDGKDIEIGGKVIGESTKITLSVKTALWIIGIVIALFSTIFTYAYFDVKADVDTYKKKLEDSNKAFVKQVEDNISIKLEKERDRDDKFIEDIAKIKGDIQLILDRTQRLGGNTPIVGAPTINNNNPSDVVPVRTH
jgi:hypothetical protein